MILSPDVTEILDDPEIGGGQKFTVFRRKATNGIDGVMKKTEIFQHTGNVQPASPDDLQLLSEEERSSPTIVIRSTFMFQMGENTGANATYTEPDEVQAMGHVWKISRLDPWNAWGFTTAWFTLRKDGVVNANYPGARLPGPHA